MVSSHRFFTPFILTKYPPELLKVFFVQCLQVDDVILYCHQPCAAVLVGVVFKDLLGIKSIQVVAFSRATIVVFLS